MKQMSYAAALVDGLWHAMETDDRVVVVSSHLLGLGPHRALMNPLHERFHDRFIEPPNSEAALAGLGAGAAMVGDRPLINFSPANFTYLAWSQIANDAGTAHHMTNGAIRVPVVFYAMHGVRGGGALSTAPARRRCCGTVPAWKSCCRLRRPTPRDCSCRHSRARTRPSSSRIPSCSAPKVRCRTERTKFRSAARTSSARAAM